jgi:SAM-dependent methyltransferase
VTAEPDAAANARAWGLPRVVAFFDRRRDTTAEVYPSEWVFLKEKLVEGLSVLDVGAAQGGFAAVLAEHLKDFSYTGIDINADMVARARARFPAHSFHHVAEGDFAALGEARFDLVLVLGILHLHEGWRATLAGAWARTRGALILDLRETWRPGIEDKARSYFRMDFNGGGGDYAEARLPYNVINSADAIAEIARLCPGHARIRQHGYTQPPGGAARTPFETVIAKAYCVER